MNFSKDLSKVMDTSIKEYNLDYLTEYFSSYSEATQAFNATTMSLLFNTLKKDGKYEDKTLHVKCILTCLQCFLEIEVDRQIWEQFAEEISRLCELVFVISNIYIKDETLIVLNIHIAILIMELTNSIADSFLRYMLKPSLNMLYSFSCSIDTRLTVLGFIGSLLQKSSRQIRCEVLPTISPYLEKLSNHMMSCGDYETQVAIVEIIARSWIYIKNHNNDPNLFSECPKILEFFKRYNFLNFDPECRLFLNETNEWLGDNQLVYSLPSVAIYSDNTRLKKPINPEYKEFWVDFNTISSTLSLYYFDVKTNSWDIMRISNDFVLFAVSKNSSCQSKSGVKIDTVKMEINIKNGENKAELPNILKIYFCKNEKFAKVEVSAIQKIFKNKYTSQVSYKEDLLVDNKCSLPSSELTLRLKESIKSKDNSSTTPNIISARQKSITQEPDVKELRKLEQNTTDFKTSLKYVEQVANKNYKTTTSKTEVPITSNTNMVSTNSEMKEVQDQLVENRNMKTVKATSNNTADNLKSTSENKSSEAKGHLIGQKQVALPETQNTKEQSTLKFESSVPSSVTTQQKKCSKNVLEVQTSNKTIKKIRLYSSERSNQLEQVTSSQDDYSEQQQCKFTKKENITNDIRKSINRSNITYSYRSNKDKDHDLQTSNNLFTDLDDNLNGFDNQLHCFTIKDKNSNTVCSENMQNKLKTNHMNDMQSLVSEKYTKAEAKQKSNLHVSDYDCQTQYFFTSNIKPKQTAENAKGIFPSNTGYSDLPATERNKHVGKTYARPKPKRKRRKVAKIPSSDSDSDYIPPVNISPNCNVQNQRAKRVSKIPVSECFVSKLTNDTIDPIRDSKPTTKTELTPLNLGEIETIKSRELDVHISPINIAESPVEIKDELIDNNKIKKSKRKGTKLTINSAKKPKVQNKKVSSNKNIEKLTCDFKVCDMDFEPPEFDNISGNDDLALEILDSSVIQDKSLMQTSFKMNEIMQFGKLCLTKVKTEIQRVESLALKEREMNFAEFDFKAHTSCSAMHKLCQKLEIISRNLLKVKTILDTTYSLQEDVALQFQTQIGQLEEAKQALAENINEIGKSETSQISNIFLKMGTYVKNIVFSFIQKNTKKKNICTT